MTNHITSHSALPYGLFDDLVYGDSFAIPRGLSSLRKLFSLHPRRWSHATILKVHKVFLRITVFKAAVRSWVGQLLSAVVDNIDLDLVSAGLQGTYSILFLRPTLVSQSDGESRFRLRNLKPLLILVV